MSKEIKWVNIHDRLPEKYVQVLTLLYRPNSNAKQVGTFYNLCVNRIQGRHVREADGNLITVYQWEEENLRVEYWLDGLPELPKVPSEPQENK